MNKDDNFNPTIHNVVEINDDSRIIFLKNKLKENSLIFYPIQNECLEDIYLLFHNLNENNIKTKYPTAKYCIIDDQIDFVGNLQNGNYEYYKELEKNYSNIADCTLQSTLSFLLKCVNIVLIIPSCNEILLLLLFKGNSYFDSLLVSINLIL